MMKFTMNAKELKTMMDKAVTVVNKKVPVPSLKRLYFSVDNKGVLKILSTDIEHYIEVRTQDAYHTEPGMFGIDIEDNLSQMPDDVFDELVKEFGLPTDGVKL